jgi:hypothetical protein
VARGRGRMPSSRHQVWEVRLRIPRWCTWMFRWRRRLPPQPGAEQPVQDRPAAEEPVPNQPETGKLVEATKVVGAAGGGSRGDADIIMRTSASGSNSALVLHNRPAAPGAGALFAVYRRDLLARNANSVEELHAMECSMGVSVFSCPLFLKFFGRVVPKRRADWVAAGSGLLFCLKNFSCSPRASGRLGSSRLRASC